MFGLTKRLDLVFAMAILGLCMMSCGYEEPPLSFAAEPGLFKTWTLIEESAECNQNGNYVSNSHNHEIQLKIRRDLTYHYLVDGELILQGDFIAFSETITFVPPIYPDNINDHSTYLFTGPNLITTTTEFFSQGSIETCDVRRVYGRR